MAAPDPDSSLRCPDGVGGARNKREMVRYLECFDPFTGVVYISSVGTLLSGMTSHPDGFLRQGLQPSTHQFELVYSPICYVR